MKIIVCVDNNNGMMFNNRRVSKDRIVRNKILDIVKDSKLYMNTYSSNQFEDLKDIIVDDNFLEHVSDDDFCFVENKEFNINKVNIIYMLCWNRDYPADLYFNYNLLEEGFNKIYEEEFEGFSHPKITLKVFKRG